MRPLPRLPNPPRPLPQVLDPKLAPFAPTAYADIEFIEQLGDPTSNKDGHVWKVKINGTGPFYALKMVRIYYSHYDQDYTPQDRALSQAIFWTCFGQSLS